MEGEDLLISTSTTISPIISLIVSLVSLAIAVLIVVACARIAKRKNRSVGGWVVGGIFLGLLGLIIIACLPEKK